MACSRLCGCWEFGLETTDHPAQGVTVAVGVPPDVLPVVLLCSGRESATPAIKSSAIAVSKIVEASLNETYNAAPLVRVMGVGSYELFPNLF